MRPLFTNTARKKKAELCATVTLSITGDTSHRGPPNLPETAAGRPHKVFLQSSPGQIKALALFTHRPQALWGQPQTHRGVLGMTAAVRASSQNLPSSLLMFRDERDSGARQNCLHHHIPPPLPPQKTRLFSGNRTINYQACVEKSALSWIRPRRCGDEKELH